MKDRDLLDIAIVFIFIILISWIIGLKIEIRKSYDEKIEIMKIALENDRLNREYIDVLIESREQLNKALDGCDNRNKQLEDQSEILKDLRLVNNYQLVIALCFPENRFSKKRLHKDKSIIGKQCGIKAYWIDIIPELNYDNINSLKGGELVLDYLLDKNNGDLFEALKDYKGSNKNLEPVYKTLKLYKEIK